jgi:hypothetical protein
MGLGHAVVYIGEQVVVWLSPGQSFSLNLSSSLPHLFSSSAPFLDTSRIVCPFDLALTIAIALPVWRVRT